MDSAEGWDATLQDVDTIWGRAADVIWLPHEDGDVLLLADGAELPIHIDPPGLALWEAIEEPRSLGDIAAALAPDGDAVRVADEVRELLRSLEGLGLCRVVPGAADLESPAKGLG